MEVDCFQEVDSQEEPQRHNRHGVARLELGFTPRGVQESTFAITIVGTCSKVVAKVPDAPYIKLCAQSGLE